MSALIAGAVSAGASVLGGAVRQAGNLIDIATSPDTLRSLGSVELAKIANGDMSFIEDYKVEDWEVVADTYEKTGYRVDIVHNMYHMYFWDWLDTIIPPVKRYYFNPLQVSQAELESDINIPATLMADFEMRLKNGIRLWHVSNAGVRMGSYDYDNVEEAYI